ncbi:DMT family transporter [Acinetobacter puyangensis]|uniref:DMT family transporter n=1 Tax=Acinetobacter puyangensis TaxID=1096779 RepID=UPI003A4D5FE3
MAYALLALAIFAEIIAAISTRFSEGFSKPLPTAIAIIGVVTAYYLLSLVLNRGIPIGVAYAIWAALGVASVAIIGAVFLNDKLTLIQWFGILLVILGVLSLELGGNFEKV